MFRWLLQLRFRAVVFVPLHFLTQGYLTTTGNLVALALYQAPVNLIALCLVWIIPN